MILYYDQSGIKKKNSQLEISYRIERKELNVDITKPLWSEKKIIFILQKKKKCFAKTRKHVEKCKSAAVINMMQNEIN